MMTGFVYLSARKWPLSLAVAATFGLAACDENGEFAFPGADNASQAAAAPLPANALGQRVQRDIDIERPDIFAINSDGLWDGRPSLGGVWVAHPEVRDPERVVIRNTEGGQEVIGALFRRERDNPGPLLQVSSDAADALGMLPGAPARLEVVVLRRQEVEVPAAEENPVVASLAAPVAVEAAPLDAADVDVDAEESGAGEAAAATTAVVLPAAVEAATAAAEETAAATATAAADVATPNAPIDVSAVLAAPAPLPAGSLAQIGVFSVERNANNAVATIAENGIEATVNPEELGGRTVWRVIAGPLTDAADVTRLKELGFVDAFVIDATE
ncbi:Cell division protein DedD (protein involved in septation) [Yoonia rosea]|uniref:Cell division protein DedD (Protein involved in septation) n=1 Tax=Yoonia rosea TaxID=287098 RepID=A0A1R3WSZ9_9RHOB|nr:Cell division protein DedD (protein involved in septation) [Yoonia rosea]